MFLCLSTTASVQRKQDCLSIESLWHTIQEPARSAKVELTLDE